MKNFNSILDLFKLFPTKLSCIDHLRKLRWDGFVVLLLGITTSVSSQTLTNTKFYQNNPSLGGECLIKKSTVSTKDGISSTTFDVCVDKSGSYYASFWMLPAQKEDGTCTSYGVCVNNERIPDALKSTAGDWQCLGLQSKIWLNKGLNTISVLGVVPEIPEVEFVKVSKTPAGSEISSERYLTDKKNRAVKSQAQINTEHSILLDTLDYNRYQNVSRANSAINDPIYDYLYLDWVPLKYTFYKKMYFTKDQTITVSTSAQNNFNNVIELFSATEPETYSWAVISNSGKANISKVAPTSGYYYVRVRSYLNGRDGIANVTINGNTYSDVQLFSIGYTHTIGTDQYYNSFTVSEASDPIMWMEGDGMPGVILAYNDDYQEESDHEWGSSSRIHKKLSKTISAVHISAYSSYKPESGLKMYVKCKDSDAHEHFPNLKKNDAIASSPASSVYNCISWSGGITSYWEWPGDIFSDYYVANDALASFDKFYSSERYSGCSIYTRNYVRKDESVVDLWALKTSNGYDYTHASIKVGADEHYHGYAWESKPGHLTRTFHPRFALEGDDYGQVVAYYARTNSSTKSISLDESLSEGLSLLEHVDFSDTELAIINKKIAEISFELRTKFETYLSMWEDRCSKSIYSSPTSLKRCEEYENLLTLCKNNDELKYLIYSRLDNDDHFMLMLIEDLLVNQNSKSLIEVKNENAALTKKGGTQIVRTPLGNAMKFIKKILGTDDVITTKYSNADNIEVKNVGNSSVTIGISLEKPSRISLEVSNQNGVVVSSITQTDKEKGYHTISIPVTSHGIHFVKCIVNGNVNIKKITL